MDSSYSDLGQSVGDDGNWSVLSGDQSASPRAKWIPIAFAVPTLFCALSWQADGIPILTDIGWVIMTGICLGCFISELIHFRRRFGIGGLVLYGGTLSWYCDDYLKHWAFSSSATTVAGYPPGYVAKAAFYICLFVTMASWGLNIRKGRWFQRLFLSIPELKDPQWCFWLIIALFLFGIGPYFYFTNENGFLAIYHQIVSGRSGEGPKWIAGRTGNVNFNWSGYIAQVIAVGQIGGVYAMFYAILVARNPIAKAISWSIWVLWLLLGFGTGTRGEVVMMVLTLILVLFIKYNSAGMESGLNNLRIYIISGALLLATLVVVQIMGIYRDAGFQSVDLNKVDLYNIQGNGMFSEGAHGFVAIPDQHPFFLNEYGVDGIVRPIPDFVVQFVIWGIPRALWHDKPVDVVWAWYNHANTGESNSVQGTTIAAGLVTNWYIRYGFFGVFETSLLFGWLLSMGERVLEQAGGRLNLLLMALAWEVWLFRSFRGVTYGDLWDEILGMICISIFVFWANSFSGQTGAPAPIEAVA